MNTGIPVEIMYGEGRVALIPAACSVLTSAGHRVFMETRAGLGSGYTDEDYSNAGVEIVDNQESLYEAADLIVKVKQPLEEGLKHLQARHTVFSFLHLAPQPVLTRQLCDIGLTAIAFESVVDESGHRPLLAPMSKVAGRLAVLAAIVVLEVVLESPLRLYLGIAAEVLGTPLLPVEDDWVAFVFAPINSVAGLIGFVLLGLNILYRKIVY